MCGVIINTVFSSRNTEAGDAGEADSSTLSHADTCSGTPAAILAAAFARIVSEIIPIGVVGIDVAGRVYAAYFAASAEWPVVKTQIKKVTLEIRNTNKYN